MGKSAALLILAIVLAAATSVEVTDDHAAVLHPESDPDPRMFIEEYEDDADLHASPAAAPQPTTNELYVKRYKDAKKERAAGCNQLIQDYLGAILRMLGEVINMGEEVTFLHFAINGSRCWPGGRDAMKEVTALLCNKPHDLYFTCATDKASWDIPDPNKAMYWARIATRTDENADMPCACEAPAIDLMRPNVDGVGIPKTMKKKPKAAPAPPPPSIDAVEEDDHDHDDGADEEEVVVKPKPTPKKTTTPLTKKTKKSKANTGHAKAA